MLKAFRREEYLKEGSVDRWADEFLSELARKSWPFIFEPSSSALIVIDMQEFFFSPSSDAFVPSVGAIMERVERCIEAFRRSERPVVFTRHIDDEGEDTVMTRWWGGKISAEDPLSRLHPGFDVSEAIVIEKSQYDAFFGSRLEEFLRESRSKQVVITGVLTHLCCETTARGAFMRNFEVFFPVDGTATYNEDFHRATLLNLSHGFAVLTTCNDIIRSMG